MIKMTQTVERKLINQEMTDNRLNHQSAQQIVGNDILPPQNVNTVRKTITNTNRKTNQTQYVYQNAQIHTMQMERFAVSDFPAVAFELIKLIAFAALGKTKGSTVLNVFVQRGTIRLTSVNALDARICVRSVSGQM
jgi:hypothetical protein